MSSRPHQLGRFGEELAARWLRRAGYQILARNWRSPAAEVDLVCRQGELTLLCEVKTRRTSDFGAPSEAVTPERIERLRQAAEQWLALHPGGSIRIDCITVLLTERGIRIQQLAEVSG